MLVVLIVAVMDGRRQCRLLRDDDDFDAGGGDLEMLVCRQETSKKRIP